jgi:SAM-dependent methyltransferase
MAELPTLPAHVEALSRPRDFAFKDEWYDLAAESHFWFRARADALFRLLRDRSVPREAGLKVLEVGCGTGVLRAQLEAQTSWSVDAADLDLSALARCAPGRGRTLYYDVREEQEALKGAYDGLVLFDVLEHITEPEPFLTALLAHVKPGGFLIINVPALQWLYSEYDRVVGHVKRYDRASLAAELASCGWTIIETRFWGMSMVPILLARKLILGTGRKRSDGHKIRLGFQPALPMLNSALRGIMCADAALTRGRAPAGSSLLLLGRRT